jgi:L-threonylcarbamoyladenylate synthase
MDNFFDTEVEAALMALRNGKVILYPTDTIWGLGCDATNVDAVQRIYSIKERPDAKSLIILAAEERDILRYVAAPDPSVFDFWEAQEKPTTIIFENAIGLPNNLIAEDGSIAIRLMKDPFCRHLIKRLGAPIVSTSANISGQASPTSFKTVSDTIQSSVDHIVKWRRDEEVNAQPSRIVKWNSDGSHHLIRP